MYNVRVHFTINNYIGSLVEEISVPDKENNTIINELNYRLQHHKSANNLVVNKLLLVIDLKQDLPVDNSYNP